MNAKKLVLVCLVLATAIVLLPSTSDVRAATTITGTWSIHTYLGHNQTQTFAYPQIVNATVQPTNISVSGQRFVSIADATNSSHLYFSTSIGFYPAGTNTTTGKVNISWPIPSSLADGGTVQLAVGLSGVKTPESYVILTIQQNLSSEILKVVAPIISGFQNQITYLQQQLDAANAATAAAIFQGQQIEALEGLAIAGLIGYIVYSKRRAEGKKEEFEKSSGEFEQVVIATAVENAEPGEKAALEQAAVPKPAEA